jgi:hypothetical protein
MAEREGEQVSDDQENEVGHGPMMMAGMMYRLNGRTPVKCENAGEILGTMMGGVAKKIRETKLGYTTVETVFSAMPLGLSENGSPLLFSTLVAGGPLSGESKRYAIYDDADFGHSEIVKRATKAQFLPKHIIWIFGKHIHIFGHLAGEVIKFTWRELCSAAEFTFYGVKEISQQ